MNDFKAIDFLKHRDINTLIDVLNFWEDWRCAVGEEDWYNLKDAGDFSLFIEQFGVEKSVEYYNNALSFPAYLFGNAFDEPKKVGFCYALKTINDFYTIDYFIELIGLGWYDKLNEWFDMKEVVKYITSNNHCIQINFNGSEYNVKEIMQMLKDYCKNKHLNYDIQNILV